MNENLSITATFVTYNCAKKAKRAVMSIKQHTKKYPLEIFVFDNGSSDNPRSLFENEKGVNFVENGANLGFGAAHNKILEQKTGKYIAVINPDITVDSDVLSKLADMLEQNPDIDMVMPKILNSDKTEQKLPKKQPTVRYLFLGRLSNKIRREYTMADIEFKEITDIDFCSGCFFMIRSETFLRLGGFDDRFFMYMEDADLTRRVKKSGRVVFYPFAEVIHDWERGSAKSLKLLKAHIISFFKYSLKWRRSK